MPNLIEQKAISVAKRYLRNRGYAVEDVTRNRAHKGYDLVATKGGEALKFVNRVGELAEEQGHHPDIFLAWGKAGITLWTHAIDGLTESDFIMAAKMDQFYQA